MNNTPTVERVNSCDAFRSAFDLHIPEGQDTDSIEDRIYSLVEQFQQAHNDEEIAEFDVSSSGDEVGNEVIERTIFVKKGYEKEFQAYFTAGLN